MTGRGGTRTSREVIEVLAIHHALRRALHVVQIDDRIEVDRAHGLLGHGALVREMKWSRVQLPTNKTYTEYVEISKCNREYVESICLVCHKNLCMQLKALKSQEPYDRYRSAHSFEASADRDTGSPPRQEAVFA